MKIFHRFILVILIGLLMISLLPHSQGKGLVSSINSSQTTVKEDLVSYNQESGAMLQAFYWLTPDNGEWWNMLESRTSEFANVGFDSIWTPPAAKTPDNNVARAGYEPYDYYDLGEYDQMGGIETRYGSRAELENFISTANAHNVSVIADVVINHRRGGSMEYNPIASELYSSDVYTPTDFSEVASGKLTWDYSDFHPCETKEADNYQFANFADVCHSNPVTQSELIEYGKWLKDEVGFDGWRFDVALGIDASMLKAWGEQVGGQGVAEYWGGFYNNLTDYIDAGDGAYTAFDFYTMYALRWFTLSTGGFNMRELSRSGLANNGYTDQVITFVTNHDTVREETVSIEHNLHLAYAYILTHEAYPSVFWQDYMNPDLQPYLKAFLGIRNQFAKGSTSILYNDGDVYIAQRNGEPGLIIALNDHQTVTKKINVQTKWLDTVLHEQTGQDYAFLTDEDGYGTVTIPPMSYAIYAPGEPQFVVHAYPNREENQMITKIPSGDFSVDSQLELGYSYPVSLDIYGDAFQDQRDLSNLYLGHDNEDLYIGFSYGKNYFTKEKLTYGIAIDTKPGGNYFSPEFENVRYALGGQPDYVSLLSIDNTSTWNEISDNRFYNFNEDSGEWELISTENAYSSDSVFGFAELKISLNDLDLQNGGNIAVKVFSVSDEHGFAYDSLPHDDSLEASDGNSWLSIPQQMELVVSDDETTTTESSETDNSTESASIQGSSSNSLDWTFSALIIVALLPRYIKLRNVET